jgi:hypothetical protein
MKIKASIVVMSHLSDAQECLGVGMSQETANSHINFAKYLIFHLGSDLRVEIDADEWYIKFCESATNKQG